MHRKGCVDGGQVKELRNLAVDIMCPQQRVRISRYRRWKMADRVDICEGRREARIVD